VVEPVETHRPSVVEPVETHRSSVVELVETPDARWLEAEGDRLLNFATASRHPDGGFAWLDDAGRPELDRPVELWITCRMTHVFSLGHMLGRPDCGPLADHGVAALRARFRDAVNGGWYAAVDTTGPTTRSKTAYPHAFVVLAAASAVCADRPGAAELLDEALDVLLGHFWDDEYGMVAEEFDETFSTVDAYRGVNANMHAVEALLSAADVTGDSDLRDRALRSVTRVVEDLAPAHDWRIPEHFDSSWNPLPDYNIESPADPFRPYGATIGHWLEWARLSLHMRAALGPSAPEWLLDNAVSLFDAAVREGWTGSSAVEPVETPGFVYTVDWSGNPVVRERMHWVPAEATATAAALYAATGDASYAGWYQTWWDHLATFFIDTGLGSWHHELDPTNHPSSTVWSGKPDVYHAFQATLIPRLPLVPTLATALRDGHLGR
jgi:mannose/cellobiose epimerase-like protein (N-acyl-D-glucosamine 2-epimerase family)